MVPGDVEEEGILGGVDSFHRAGDLPHPHDVEGSGNCSFCRADPADHGGSEAVGPCKDRRGSRGRLGDRRSIFVSECRGKTRPGDRSGRSLDHQSLPDLEGRAADDGRCSGRLGDRQLWIYLHAVVSAALQS